MFCCYRGCQWLVSQHSVHGWDLAILRTYWRVMIRTYRRVVSGYMKTQLFIIIMLWSCLDFLNCTFLNKIKKSSIVIPWDMRPPFTNHLIVLGCYVCDTTLLSLKFPKLHGINITSLVRRTLGTECSSSEKEAWVLFDQQPDVWEGKDKANTNIAFC